MPSGPADRKVAAVAVAAFVVCASAHIPLARLFRYATLTLPDSPGTAVEMAFGAAALALVHEKLVRGELYRALSARLAPGMGAAVTAVAGALVPLLARVVLLPVPGVGRAIVVSHAALVEVALSLGLCWLALGTGSTLPSAVALTGVWVVRFLVPPTFRGGVVPLMELLAAILAGWLASVVLRRELAPHREAFLSQ